MKYIVTLEPYEQFNINKESLGMSGKLAVYYSPKVGRGRYYRQQYKYPDSGLKLLTFKRKENAEKVAERTREVSGQDYKVEEIE